MSEDPGDDGRPSYLSADVWARWSDEARRYHAGWARAHKREQQRQAEVAAAKAARIEAFMAENPDPDLIAEQGHLARDQATAATLRTMSGIEVFDWCGDDAGRWAIAFRALVPDPGESDLATWFANAMQAARDGQQRRHELRIR